jgi:small conductance mechanosensitive channel
MARRARRRLLALLPFTVAVVALYVHRRDLLGVDLPIRVGAVLALLALGWNLARELARTARPVLRRRLDPAAAGTVSFLVRLVTVAITAFAAIETSGLTSGRTLVVGGTVTAVIFGLAAQQTLTHLVAGAVLFSMPTLRVGQRVRLQGGGIAGELEGVVASLGLLYLTLAEGEQVAVLPNSVVLGLAVTWRRVPRAVEVLVHVPPDLRPQRLQNLLEEAIETPTRASPHVDVEELHGGDVVARVVAVPDDPGERLRLSDEILDVVSKTTQATSS